MDAKIASDAKSKTEAKSLMMLIETDTDNVVP